MALAEAKSCGRGVRRYGPAAACALLGVAAACSGPDAASARAAASSEGVAIVEDALERALSPSGAEVSVIVMLREPAGISSDPSARQAAIARSQDTVSAAQGDGFVVSRRYGSIPAIAALVTKPALERLRMHPAVARVQRDGTGHGHLNVAVPAIGGDKVKSLYGLTGHGVRVAVLDTGVDTTHPDLSDSIVAQHCFTQYDCPPLRATEGTSAEDDHGHGSNVAGIITSNGVVSSRGFAPDAEIVAVKVDDANDSGQVSDWLAGLDWVYQNLSTLKVNLVNLSFGTDDLYQDAASCDAAQPAFAMAVHNLVDAGVAVFAASGNEGSSTEMSSPACNTGTIAVGATYDSVVAHEPPNYATYQARWGSRFASCGDDATTPDEITCFTNSNARLDLVAPGAPIVSDTIGGGTEAYFGTSQASPVAAGVAALMLQCKPTLSPANIKSAMIATGVRRTDPKNGMSFPSLRALAAVQAVCFPDGGAPLDGGGAAEASAVSTASDGGATVGTTDDDDAGSFTREASAPGGGSSSQQGTDATDTGAFADATGPAPAGCACQVGRAPDRAGSLAALVAFVAGLRRIRLVRRTTLRTAPRARARTRVPTRSRRRSPGRGDGPAR
jgi:subtilisin family serine protease